MILMREKCTFSRSRDCHGLFFMNKQRMCVWARKYDIITNYSSVCVTGPVYLFTVFFTIIQVRYCLPLWHYLFNCLHISPYNIPFSGDAKIHWRQPRYIYIYIYIYIYLFIYIYIYSASATSVRCCSILAVLSCGYEL